MISEILVGLLLVTFSQVNTIDVAASPKRPDVSFFLWTNRNPSFHLTLYTDDNASVEYSYFDKGGPIKFVTHGYMSSCFTAIFVNMQDHINAYLTMVSNVNVICIDWEPLAKDLYPSAAANTAQVGLKTAQFIDFLIREGFTTADKIMFQGHSLGAHVAGYTGQYMTRGRLPYIIGLDPAGPSFEGASPDKRLDPSDADFVQIIHTDGKGVVMNYGTLQVMGHVDFYPAGGHDQPYCIDAADLFGCSHFMAAYYINEGIGDGPSPQQGVRGFWSCPCPTAPSGVITAECRSCASGSKALMGPYLTNTGLRGQFYLDVGKSTHFCRG